MDKLHEIDVRIKSTLATCHPVLVHLLEYFSLKSRDGKSQPNTILTEILRTNKKEAKRVLPPRNHCDNYMTGNIDIAKLEVPEICDLLLSVELSLMTDAECCTHCEHICTTCPDVHTELVTCIKSQCRRCGCDSSDCSKQCLLNAIIVIKTLYEVNTNKYESYVYVEFNEDKKPFNEFPFCYTWESLWKRINKSINCCLEYLHMKGYIKDEVQKDMNMDMRNSLKKTTLQLISLFEDQVLKTLPGLISESSNKINTHEEYAAYHNSSLQATSPLNTSIYPSTQSRQNQGEGAPVYMTLDTPQPQFLQQAKGNVNQYNSSSSTDSVSPLGARAASSLGARATSPLGARAASPLGARAASPPGAAAALTSPVHYDSSSSHQYNYSNSSSMPPSETIDDEEMLSSPFQYSLTSYVKLSGSSAKSLTGSTLAAEAAYVRSNRRLVLIRGLPGSGKTTKAKEYTKDSGVILATDDYFINANGVYVFDATKLKEAHKWNQDRTRDQMINTTSPICIDNTNIQAWEMKAYVVLAKRYQFTVEIAEPDTEWAFHPNKLVKKTSHNIPKNKIDKMKEKYEKDVTLESILRSKAPK